MTPGDAARVLAACALFDNRKVKGEEGEAVAKAWFAVIGDLPLADALEAVRRHYQNSTEWMMPAHVRRGVKAIQAERRASQPHEIRTLPSRFERDIAREVNAKAGPGQARDVIAQLTARLAQASGKEPDEIDALTKLRELTPGPSWADEEAREGEATQ